MDACQDLPIYSFDKTSIIIKPDWSYMTDYDCLTPGRFTKNIESSIQNPIIYRKYHLIHPQAARRLLQDALSQYRNWHTGIHTRGDYRQAGYKPHP